MFTSLGKIIAYLGSLVGITFVGASFYIDGLPPDQKIEILVKYWGGSVNTGDLADYGFVMLFCAITIGILSEISTKLDK